MKVQVFMPKLVLHLNKYNTNNIMDKENANEKKFIYLFRIINIFILLAMIVIFLLTYISINTNLRNVNKFVELGIKFFDKSNTALDKVNSNLDDSFLLLDTTLLNLNRSIYKVDPLLNQLVIYNEKLFRKISPNEIYNILINFNETIGIIRYDALSVLDNLNNTINNYKQVTIFKQPIAPNLGLNY